MRPADCDVLVIGGGVTGCAAAWHLAGYGARVILLEEFDLNTQASGRNAGSLHGQIQFPSFAERGEEWGRSFLPALRFLRESLRMWDTLGEELGVDLEVSRGGGILAADSPGQMRLIERKAALEKSAGVESDILDGEDLRRAAPYLSPALAGGQLCPGEGKANPLLAAPALARAARERGADIRTNLPVLGLEQAGGRFTAVTGHGPVTARRVIAAMGNRLNRFSRMWGRPLPVADEPAQLAVTEPLAPFVKFLIYFAGDKLTLKQAAAGNVLIGGGWAADPAPDSGGPRVNPASLVGNVRAALRVVPSLGGARLFRTWAGTGLATPDLRPVIGAPGPPGLWAGVYPHMGLTAGPLLGRTLARLALDLPPEMDLEPFSPHRF